MEQPIKKLVVHSTSYFNGECLKKGCLMTVDGSDDDKIKPDDLPKYRVPPPYNYRETYAALPQTPTCEPTAESDNLQVL